MKVLVIAPHPDDEVLGVGGTIAKYSSSGHDVYVCIVTSGSPKLASEAQIAQGKEDALKADKLLGVKETSFLGVPAVMVETLPRYELNAKFVGLIDRIDPDIVYLPHRGDIQLDHKLIADAAMVALRPGRTGVKKIYAYETLSETGWDIPNAANEFIPTVYNDINGFLDLKLSAMECFTAQVQEYPQPRSAEALRALAMYRGSTMGMHAAEAFMLIREIVREEI